MSEIDLSGKSDADLKALIENHERKRVFGGPLLLAALAEQAARGSKGLNADRTIALIHDRARQRLHVTYKEVAEASEQSWDQVRWKVFDHLGDVSIRSHQKDKILLSAVVVAEPHRVDGLMDRETLAGFIRFARLLNLHPTGSATDFLCAEQEKVFAWAKERASA